MPARALRQTRSSAPGRAVRTSSAAAAAGLAVAAALAATLALAGSEAQAGTEVRAQDTTTPPTPAASSADPGGLSVTARTSDPEDPHLVLTNRGAAPCVVVDTSLGTVALTRVEAGGTGVEPELLDVNFIDLNLGEAVDHYLTSRLRLLAPGESFDVPLRVVPFGPTGQALQTVAWSPGTPPVGSLYPIDGEPLHIEFTYAVPAGAAAGEHPLCPPAAGSSAAGGQAGGLWPGVVLIGAAVAVVLLVVLALVLILHRRRRTRSSVAATVVLLLVAGLLAVQWSAAAPAHATIEVDDSLSSAYGDCAGTFGSPGGDPANILPTLEGDGVRVQIIPANGDQTHHGAISDDHHFIFWNTDDTHTYFGGGGNADPCTSLYHELYHAYEHHTGELDRSNCVTSAGDSGIPVSEVNATRAQNQLRALLGLPERDHYGDTPLPAGECLPPEEQPEPPDDPRCSGRGCGSSDGDPHLVTFDGARYSFQAVGEFVAARHPGQGFEVQVRQEPVPGSRLVSVNTAVAFDVAGDTVEVRLRHQGPVLLVQGQVRAEEEVALPAGGTARQVETYRGLTVAVTWPDGSTAAVRPVGRWGLRLWAQPVEVHAGGLEGLFGDFDGEPDNDLRPAGGAQPLAQPPDFDQLYPGFADSWRLDATGSLFTYPPGAGPEIYADPTFPDRRVSVAELSNRAWAEEICRRSGVTEPGALQACTLDVALTGQPDFAVSASENQAFLDVYRPEGPGTLLAIDEPDGTAEFTFRGTAGEKVFIDVGWTTLPNQCGRLLLLAPEGHRVASGCLINNRGHIDALVLPETGEYTVRLTATAGATGEARVWVVRAHDQEQSISPDGPEVTAEIGQPGAVARFTFTGRAGQKVFLDVPTATAPSQCSPLQLTGPDDAVLTSGCVINGQGYIDATVLPDTGDYTIVVDLRDRDTGRATLRLVEAVDQDGTLTIAGPAATAVIDQPGAVARFTFHGAAGQQVEVEVSATTLRSQCSPLRLIAPDGEQVSSGCVIGGTGGIAPVTLPETGEYTLVVDPRDRTTGEATLRLLVPG